MAVFGMHTLHPQTARTIVWPIKKTAECLGILPFMSTIATLFVPPAACNPAGRG
jgi:hypothetical protein